ncbi:NADH-quinone oxidoreductase subunit C [Desulfofalx alkaliphila]|uniref:NADH-quinone oxidoreductase subunit C n=1 Tax=Desulfofalx alkaliphila TaxID=105483 RepID=UPI0004E19963|nr:NADH-quinone oxidoreductase subunit C [Desulfofalx alkaliphila]
MESNQIIQQIKEEFPETEIIEKTLFIPLSKLLPVARKLREEYLFNYLTNQTATDYGEYFELVYNICRVPAGNMLMFKTRVARNNARVPSLYEIWPGAEWQEREIYDLLGIEFTNHPDLRRILMPDDYQHHPLRKDFKWVGGRD